MKWAAAESVWSRVDWGEEVAVCKTASPYIGCSSPEFVWNDGSPLCTLQEGKRLSGATHVFLFFDTCIIKFTRIQERSARPVRVQVLQTMAQCS